ncbi:MAG: D-alanyl-D-alanine carboxypeptidase family protein, partial [Clostridia bacterium]
EDQQFAIDEFYKEKLRDNGNNEELAKKETDEYCAKVGFSEHHSGLAVDLIIPTANATIPDKIKTLYNSPKYANKLGFIFKRMIMEKHGFILTYPQDDRIEEITGMKHNEGWHWRYVGASHSKMIAKIRERVSHKLNKPYEIFLEDYVELLNKQTYAIDEEQYIDEVSDLFINEILKLENTDIQSL